MYTTRQVFKNDRLNQPVGFEDLTSISAVLANTHYRYAQGILEATSKSIEQVTIEPTGKWIAPGAEKATVPDSAEASFVDDDDVYVSEVLSAANHDFSTPGRSTTGVSTLMGTPMNGSTGGTPSLARSSTTNNNGKRPAPEVIDLTLSDDDEPPRPVKRANYGDSYYGSLS